MDTDTASARRAIRIWLAEHEKTQDWLARKVRIHVTTLSRVLTGSLPPSDMHVTRIERVTGINIREFKRVA